MKGESACVPSTQQWDRTSSEQHQFLSQESALMMLQLYRVSSASCPQRQVFMDTQGKAKPEQYFPPNALQPFSVQELPDGEVSTKTCKKIKGPRMYC